MSSIVAFLVLAVVYYIGEFVGTKTKAWIPSVFVIASLFLFGYWTFFPKDIVALAGMGAPLGGTLVIMLCITHMGTIISIRQLLDQWKIICITLAGLAGMVALCWFVCIPLVGRAYVIAGLPPLTGGIVAVLAIAMYAVQGFFGYPLTAVCLKLEGRRLLKKYRSGEVQVNKNEKVDTVVGNMATGDVLKYRIFPEIPAKYSSTALILAKLMFSAYLASLAAKLTGINMAVLALLFGIVFTELGFLEKDALHKAGSYGFLMYVLMIFVFAGLKDATSLTALYGFPPNYILTEESVKALAETPEEHQYLLDAMLPQMIVGGFVTVTITSVIIAGIFIGLL